MDEYQDSIQMQSVGVSEGPERRNGSHINPNPGPTSEKVILLEKRHRVTLETAVILRHGALIVSWLSVITSIVLGITAVYFAWKNISQSLFSFGLDSLLDCVSSIIVLWRFYGAETLYSTYREMRACALIGILFVIAAFVLAIKSLWALAKHQHTEQLHITLILSAVNVSVCLLLGFGKIFLGYKLESKALITDSVITLVGAAMSIFTLIFSTIYETNESLWYLDNSFGLLCSLFLLIYGLRVLWTSIGRHESNTEQ